MNKSKKRPVFISLHKVKVPITAYVSFAHRVTGVLFFLSFPLVLYAFYLSLASEAGFNTVVSALDHWFVKLITLGVFTAFIYHVFAGIKHMINDMGYGEELDSAKKMSYVVLFATAVAVIGMAYKLFG
ncbi:MULTISPECIES: succinate dehydrogenase, cytochrome b556 subunit [Pseudoalteromonas]|uniref:succinate dehydrogenase, cytochrome b556 subunit n=1 Tax=Pseudoalteromonas TaxID=53246 RepID=UPI000FFEB804|nr:MULTISPECIES: succinate dehydrogenase, cytochrome b556 subunit [Pseudoalteromonas]MCG9758373.1 succinate dehydrogenase, cytochrome b556 subunit [Pseudoalteromonas sp. Isolate6]NKC17595.1 succinate dehydrogenase, cytochrome b556 subunit [Pseudoalteromonas galatheae]RXE84371.1 succinate dehydrogenase, cytochrome b556 subunit [Pseudoalteromonas sp. A757]